MSKDDWDLSFSFWVDTDAYSNRDREMFTAGFEFATILRRLRTTSGDRGFRMLIHRENESRIRMICGKLGRQCTIIACDQEHDPNGTWSYLRVKGRHEQSS